MNNNLNDSETLIININKILENIEVDDISIKQSIEDIKNISNQLEQKDNNIDTNIN